jgi:hypothetical protein
MGSGVTICITRIQEEAQTLLRVDGWLGGGDVAELLRVVEESGVAVALDLSELRSADRPGIDALHTLSRRGVELRRVPPLIAALLDQRCDGAA